MQSEDGDAWCWRIGVTEVHHGAVRCETAQFEHQQFANEDHQP